MTPGIPVLRVSFNHPVNKSSVNKAISLLSEKKFALIIDSKEKETGDFRRFVIRRVTGDSTIILKESPGLLSIHGKEKGIVSRRLSLKPFLNLNFWCEMS